MSDYRTPSNHVSDSKRWWQTAQRIDQGEHRTTLSLAVCLVDVYTGDQPLSSQRVSIRGQHATPIRNESGYYLFLDIDLPTGLTTVDVDGGPWYRDAEKTVFLPTEAEPAPPSDEEVINSDKSAVRIGLTPTPQYPFAADATLVRGYAINERGDTPTPLGEVPVQIDKPSPSDDETTPVLSTTTNEDGEFVFFFEGTSSVTVELEDGRWLNKVDGEDPKITVVPNDLEVQSEQLAVEVGRTAVVRFVYG